MIAYNKTKNFENSKQLGVNKKVKFFLLKTENIFGIFKIFYFILCEKTPLKKISQRNELVYSLNLISPTPITNLSKAVF